MRIALAILVIIFALILIPIALYDNILIAIALMVIFAVDAIILLLAIDYLLVKGNENGDSPFPGMGQNGHSKSKYTDSDDRQ